MTLQCVVRSIIQLLFVSAIALAADAQSIEAHVYGAALFDLPGARAVAGLGSTSTNPNTFQFQDSGERKVQPSLGGGLSITFGKNWGTYADYSYVLSDQRTATASLSGATQTVSDQRSFQLLQVGLQAQIPTDSRITPYIQVGGGFLRESESGQTTNSGNIANPGVFATNNPTENNPLLHYGGGFLCEIHHWEKASRINAQPEKKPADMPQEGSYRRLQLRVGVDGYYVRDPVFQPLPSVSPTGFFTNFKNPRHGFGRATLGLLYQFR